MIKYIRVEQLTDQMMIRCAEKKGLEKNGIGKSIVYAQICA